MVDDQRLGSVPGDEIACVVLGSVQDHVRHSLRLVDRRDTHRLDAKLGVPFVEGRRVYGPRHHLRHTDRLSLVFEFHS